MKVITHAIFQMTDVPGEYIPLGEKSYEYDGPIAHAGGDDPEPAKLPKWAKTIVKENSKLATDYGLEELDWAKDQWDTQKELMDGILNTQQGASTKMFQNADEWQQRYEKTFVPIEDQLIADAEDYSSNWRREQEAGSAAADVSQAFNAERENAKQRLESYGIDPSQTRAQALDNAVSTNEAIAKADAMNQARKDVDDKGRALRDQAIALGQPLRGDAANALTNTNLMAGNTGTAYNTALAQAQNLRSGAILPAIQTANAGALGSTAPADPGSAGWGATAGTIIGGAAGAYFGGPAGAQAGAAIGGAAGGAFAEGGPVNAPTAIPTGFNPNYPTAGGYAEGGYAEGGSAMEAIPTGPNSYDASMGYGNVGMQDGPINGPGGPKDDLINAKLSDGEYVIPAEVVKYKGTEFFDKLLVKSKEGMPTPQQMPGGAMVSTPQGIPTDTQPEVPTALPMAYGGYAGIPTVPLACGGYVSRRK